MSLSVSTAPFPRTQERTGLRKRTQKKQEYFFKEMFTRRSLSALKTFFNLHDFLKVGPYYWNWAQRGIGVHRSKLAWVLILLMASWTCFRIIWAPINFISGIKRGLPLKTTLLNYLYFQWYLGITLYHYNLFARRHQIKEFVNCMLNFNRLTSGNS